MVSYEKADAEAVSPLSWVKSECFDSDEFATANVFAPTLKACSLQRSQTFESSTTSHSIIPSPSTASSECAVSIPLDVKVRDAVFHEDAVSCARLTPGVNEDVDAFSPSSIPSSPLAEGLWMTLDEADPSTGNVNMGETLSVQGLDQNGFPIRRSTWMHGTKEEDVFLSHFDELLQMDILDCDSVAPGCAEDLCPSPLSQGFQLPESAASMPSQMTRSEEMVRNDEEPVEDVSHVFARWFKENSHLFSLSDLKNIKLKTATIENATRRLGGGKKGMLYFVKLILEWLQNHHLKQQGGGFAKEGVGGANARPGSASGVSSCAFPKVSNGVCGNARDLEISASRRERIHGAFGPDGSGNCLQLSKDEAVRQIPERGNGVREYSIAPSYNCSHIAPAPVPPEREWNPSNSSNAVVDNGSASSCFSPGSCAEGRQTFPSTGMVVTGGMCPPLCDRLALGPNTPAAATRAARKNRMERQRWSVRRHGKRPSLSSANITWPSQASGTMQDNFNYSAGSCQKIHRPSLQSPQVRQAMRGGEREIHARGTVVMQGRKAERNLKLLFQKELRQSDVGNLGRIVVPKKAAETSLPQLEVKDGIRFTVEDMDSFKVWKMRYRFWPNNKSRMYLLENTGDFVKWHNLKEGDFIMFYSSNSTNNYFIRGVKGENFETQRAVTEQYFFNTGTGNAGAAGNAARSEVTTAFHQPKGCWALESPMDIRNPESSTCDRDSPDKDDRLFAEFLEQSLDGMNYP